ncbi:SH3 domain-containing protein [Streptomyces yaizuensis]|uniref:SH3 domain-containing protein n=1 Tax=Streptomyces yaizuensis TaxID=2989713 RepID=A0AA86M9C9_9ACTN|nr:SH3 domain-containing protein [Streptomyces sp. YSPA8]BDT39490.1 hypothetical protein SYYSPA8_36860 [Streptomyces sp. YSPA8]
MRKLASCAAAAVLTASALTVAVPAAGAAQPGTTGTAVCTNPAPDFGDPGYGYTVSGRTSPLRTGPNAGCGVRKTLSANTYFEIECSHHNGSNWWYYGVAHGQGGPWYGWLYSGNIGDLYDYERNIIC